MSTTFGLFAQRLAFCDVTHGADWNIKGVHIERLVCDVTLRTSQSGFHEFGCLRGSRRGCHRGCKAVAAICTNCATIAASRGCRAVAAVCNNIATNGANATIIFANSRATGATVIAGIVTAGVAATSGSAVRSVVLPFKSCLASNILFLTAMQQLLLRPCLQKVKLADSTIDRGICGYGNRRLELQLDMGIGVVLMRDPGHLDTKSSPCRAVRTSLSSPNSASFGTCTATTSTKACAKNTGFPSQATNASSDIAGNITHAQAPILNSRRSPSGSTAATPATADNKLCDAVHYDRARSATSASIRSCAI
mmetsp:Transcript_126132/g.403666  ORF Transcript_126132/g.403666 Transcript_126132/m.403666 type:complete len:308 (+) Transcript_126132:1369-2292(+)